VGSEVGWPDTSVLNRMPSGIDDHWGHPVVWKRPALRFTASEREAAPRGGNWHFNADFLSSIGLQSCERAA